MGPISVQNAAADPGGEVTRADGEVYQAGHLEAVDSVEGQRVEDVRDMSCKVCETWPDRVSISSTFSGPSAMIDSRLGSRA